MPSAKRAPKPNGRDCCDVRGLFRRSWAARATTITLRSHRCPHPPPRSRKHFSHVNNSPPENENSSRSWVADQKSSRAAHNRLSPTAGCPETRFMPLPEHRMRVNSLRSRNIFAIMAAAGTRLSWDQCRTVKHSRVAIASPTYGAEPVDKTDRMSRKMPVQRHKCSGVSES